MYIVCTFVPFERGVERSTLQIGCASEAGFGVKVLWKYRINRVHFLFLLFHNEGRGKKPLREYTLCSYGGKLKEDPRMEGGENDGTEHFEVPI